MFYLQKYARIGIAPTKSGAGEGYAYLVAHMMLLFCWVDRASKMSLTE